MLVLTTEKNSEACELEMETLERGIILQADQKTWQSFV
jgi:hypothetical protein